MIIAHGKRSEISKSNIINRIATKKNRTSNLCRGSANGANPQLKGLTFSASGFCIANTYDAPHIPIDITPAIIINVLISISLFSSPPAYCRRRGPLASFFHGIFDGVFRCSPWPFVFPPPYSSTRPTLHLLYMVIRYMYALKVAMYVLILDSGNPVTLQRTRRTRLLFRHSLLLLFHPLIVYRLRI